MLQHLATLIRQAPEDLTPQERLLLIVLEDSRGDDGIFPSVDTLAYRTGLSPRAVHRWISSLEGRGYLEVAPRYRPDGGSTSSKRIIRYDRLEADAQDDILDESEYITGATYLEPDPEPECEEPAIEVPPPGEERPDVERLCEEVAASVERRTGARPRITGGWRTSARLMLDRDKIPLEAAVAAILWAERDDFWRANVLSVPKLRKQYQTLRLQAGRRSTPQARRDRLEAAFDRLDPATTTAQVQYPDASEVPF